MNLNQETEVIPSVDTKDSKSDQEYVTNSLSCRRWYVKKIMHFLTYVTIEPLVALTAIASSIQSVVIQRLVRDATCLKTYGFQDEYCANVTNETINLELKGIQADYNFYFVLLEISPYIFLSLFLGAWSDQHGAKFLILVSIGTNMISSMSFAIIAHLKYVHPAFILIGPTIKGLTGSHKTFHLAIDNYAVINSTKKGRTAKIAMIDLAFSLGAPTGYLLGGALYGKGNYTLVFSISLLLNLVAMLYAFLRLRKLPLTSTSTSVAFQNLFKIHHLKDAFCVLTTKRPENKRLFLILTIIASKLHQFPNSGK